MNEKLKSCPFCGGPAKVIQLPLCPEDIRSRKWVAGCDGKYGVICPGYIYKCTPFYSARELAVKMWNNRPPIAVCDNPIHISTEGVDGAMGTCLNCGRSVPKFTTITSPTKFCPHCGQGLEWDG